MILFAKFVTVFTICLPYKMQVLTLSDGLIIPCEERGAIYYISIVMQVSMMSMFVMH